MVLDFPLALNYPRVPVGPSRSKHSMSAKEQKKPELQTTRNSLLTVKMRIEEDTAIKITALKPRTLSMSTFCALLVEYGMERWEKAYFEDSEG